MAELNYNMAELFAAAFGPGNIPLRYQIGEAEQKSPAFDYSGLEVISQEDVKGQSWLGTPVNFKFGLKGGTYQYYEGGQLLEREVEDFQMPLPTMVDLSRSKRDKVTPTAGGNGAVIEMYSFDNWRIRVRGFCVYDPGHPQAESPREQRKLIQQFENLADSIELIEDDGLFTDMSIYSIYIRSIRVGQLVGKPNVLPFEMDCLSDEPVELML